MPRLKQPVLVDIVFSFTQLMTPANWQQIKSILDEALNHPPQARDSFLADACRNDESLRREVESLLAFEGEDADFIGNSAFELPEFDSFCSRVESFVGKQIGHYKITEELGVGGMGAVFLAVRDDGEFEQKVAVKLIKQGITSDDGLRRFYLERRILARLEHQNIARLIDGGTTENGLPYFVMEYVEGLPLTEYAQENNLNLDERLNLFREVCGAVGYAHRQLIVHRDLKPSNILVNGEGEVKLLDFGIAKLLKNEEIKQTRTIAAAFTPEYASPEQLRGETLSTATDIYSLGVILYELLTGARPFHFKNKNIGEMIFTVSRNEPIPPSRVAKEELRITNYKLREGAKVQSPAEENPKSKIQNLKLLRGDLDNIALKALKKEPARRYLSVEQLCDDVRRYQTGFPIAARPDTFRYRAEKFIRRNPLVFSALFFAFCAMVGGIVAVSLQVQIATTEKARAERRFNDVRRLANSFVFEINDEIDKSPIKAKELLVVRAIEYLDKLALEAESDASLQSELAAAYEKIGDVQSELFHPGLGNSGGALESHQKALKIRRALSAADKNNTEKNLDLVKSYVKIGDISAMTGKTAEALENYNAAIALNEKLFNSEPENLAVKQQLSRNYARSGQAVLRSGSISEALKNYERAIEIQKDLLRQKPDDAAFERILSIFYSYIGYAKMEMGAGAEALRDFENSLSIEKKNFASDGGNVNFQRRLSTAEIWVGVVLRNLNRTEESLVHLQKGLTIQQRIFDADKANAGEQNALADCYLELGWALTAGNQFGAAIENLEKAIANYEAVAEKDGQNTSVKRQIFFTRMHLANALAGKGEPEKALGNYEQSLAVFNELITADPNNTEYKSDAALCHLRIGELFLKTKNATKAETHFKAALPIYETLIAASPENARWCADLEILRSRVRELKKQ